MVGTLLETGRLVLEPLMRTHAAKVFQLFQDTTIYRFFPFDPPASLEQLEKRFERLEQGQSPDGKEVWLNWIARSKASGEPVGHLEATVEGRQALIAYIVFPDHQRQGYAREGCREVLRHLFEDRGVERVVALMDTRNEASVRLVASLGFRLTDTIKNADVVHGAPSDEYRYELVREA